MELILTEEHTRQIAKQKCKQIEAENKRLREALSLIVADSCSLHPSSKFTSETALKALEQKDE